MSDPMAITIIRKTYLLSNAHLAEEINEYKSVDVQWRSPPATWVDGNVKQGIYRTTWIMFAQVKFPVEINHPRHGEGIAYKKRMEVHRYIENATLSNQLSKSKTVNIEEARAEWRFWINQHFRRIMNLKDEGWTHTKKMLGAEPCIEDRPDGMYLRTNKETK